MKTEGINPHREAYGRLFVVGADTLKLKSDDFAKRLSDDSHDPTNPFYEPRCKISARSLRHYVAGTRTPRLPQAAFLHKWLRGLVSSDGTESAHAKDLAAIHPERIEAYAKATRRISVRSQTEANLIARTKSSAIDMTGLLGAESFLAERCQSDNATWIGDPKSRDCFCDLVDLFINSEKLSITLPFREKGTRAEMYPLAQFLDGKTTALADASLREPTDELEHSIHRGFWELIKDTNSDWITSWAKFQLTNPIVWRTHALRLSDPNVSKEKRVTINPKSIKQWHSGRKHRDFPMFEFELPIELLELTKEERSYFSSLSEFVACYVYDVYRRGWMYLQHVSSPANNGVYFPHPLRSTVLDLRPGWERLSVAETRDSFWSWGRLLAEILREPAPEGGRGTSAEDIIELLATIRVEVRAHELAWHQVAARSVDNSEIGFIVEKLKKIAKGKCKIRLMRIFDQPDPLEKMMRSCDMKRLSLRGLFKKRSKHEEGYPETMSPYACRGFLSKSSPFRSDF